MKQLIAALLILWALPATSWATWQVAGQKQYTTDQNGQRQVKIIPDLPLKYQINPNYTLTTQKGLLIKTVRDYAHKHNLQVLWLARRNFALNLKTQFKGPTKQLVLQRLLANYPLKVHIDHNQDLIIVVSRHLSQLS